jgi:pimeloyl-ACP methyl ester carboxylesterase
MHIFRFSLTSLFFCFFCLILTPFSHAKKEECKKGDNVCHPCCGKLKKSNCKVRKGFVDIPARTQSFFTGAPSCTSLQETVPSAKLFYRTQGKFNPHQPTIVFVHGFGETSDIWRCAQEKLCKSYYTIAMDLRGYGRSSKTPAAPEPNGIHYNVDLSTEDVFQLLKALDIKQNIVLVGHSVAVGYVLKYNALHPEQISRLVLIGGPPFLVPDCAVDANCATACFNPFTCQSGFCWPFGITTSTAAFLTAPLVACLNAGGAQKDCLRLWGEFIAPIWFNEPCQDQLKAAQGSLVSSVVSNTPAIVNSIFFFAVTEDFRVLLPNVKVPTLICFGTNDIVVNPGTGQFIHENVPNSVLAEFAGKGHQLHVTDYKNFNRLLEQFIEVCDLPDTIKVFDEGCCVCPLLKPIDFE